jgi:uncharacterized protein YdaU (DUF1376 family)
MSENPKPFAGWFDMYPERFIAGTAIMDLAERGAYITLLCHQWLAESLPADPRILARLAGGDVSPAVLDKFPICEDGKRRNAKLERVRQEQVERMQKNKGRAQRAANARWSPDAPSNAQAMLQACSKHPASMPQAYPQAMLEPCHPHPSSLIPQSSSLNPQSTDRVVATAPPPAARKRRTHEPDASACAVVPVSADAELIAAWDEWQQYRQARHRAPMNGKRIDWTEQAARLTARQVDEFARSHGARIVADRIRSAIAGGWQGLNLDKLGDSRQARGGIMSDEEYQRQADLHKPDPNSKYGF